MPFNGNSCNAEYLNALGYKGCIFLMQSLLVALTWVLLFDINAVLFKSLMVSHLISWVFLPACIRLLSVLIFEWAGVLGIFIGTSITCNHLDINQFNPWFLALISAGSPYLSAIFCRYVLKLPNSLTGLNTTQLLFFVLIGSLFNTSLNHFYYVTIDLPSSFRQTFLPMMMGDIIGCLILLYIFAFIIKLINAFFDKK
jgi:hypothetical protein